MRRMLMSGVAQAALLAVITPAMAQEAQLSEIVVTARKVQENLQDVPVAVTVQTGEQLAAQGVTRLNEIGRIAPGFTVREGSTTPTAMTLVIRGQTQTDPLATLDPSVGVYVDGYYWARAYGLNADLLDVSSVQVLKGPQGTLFGRNTTGGALLIQTNDPTHDFSGRLRVLYGRLNETTLDGAINVPIVTDKIAVRFAALRTTRDGYATNVLDGVEYGNRDSLAARVKLLITPTEPLRIVLSAEYFHTDSRNPNRHLVWASPTGLAARQAGGIANLNNEIQQITSSPNLMAVNDGERAIAKTHTYTATVTYSTDFAEFKYVGGLRRVKTHINSDLEGSSYPIHFLDGGQGLKQSSHELQATGEAIDGRLRFAAGVFYFEESGFDYSFSRVLPAILLTDTIYDGTIDNKSKGVYGQLSFALTDALSVTGGLRYSVDDKGLTSRNRAVVRATGGVSCLIAGLSLPLCEISRSDRFRGTSYTASVDYKVLPDALLYVKTSRGFRSGGENLRAINAAVFVPFRPEVATDYEAGLKSEWLDRRLRLNGAIYRTDVEDIQRTTNIVLPTGLPTTIISNAGKARFTGVELESTFAITPELLVSASYGHVSPKYIVYRDALGDRRQERFQSVAKNSFTVSGSYTHAMPIGELNIQASYSWLDKIPQTDYNNPANPENAAILRVTTAPAAGILNARVSLNVQDAGWEVALYGRNLTDNQRPSFVAFLPPPIAWAAVNYREPRTFGIEATYHFGNR